jgi:hypothetical protein
MSNGIAKTMMSGDDFEADLVEIGYPKSFDRNGLFEDVLDWLKEEGIVRFHSHTTGTNGETVLMDCAITAKGVFNPPNEIRYIGGQDAR